MKPKIIILGIMAVVLGFLISTMLYKAPKRDQEKAKGFMQQGEKFAEENNFDEAIMAYEKATEADPLSSEAFNRLGVAYKNQFFVTKKNDFKKKAIRAFKKAIKLDDKNWYPYVNLGTTLYYSGEEKNSIYWLQKAIDVNPSNPNVNAISNLIEKVKKEK